MDPDTLRQIVAEMRDCGTSMIGDYRVSDWADRIEAELSRAVADATVPVAYVRLLNGNIGWSEDCFAESPEEALSGYEFCNTPDLEPDDRYSAMPVYAALRASGDRAVKDSLTAAPSISEAALREVFGGYDAFSDEIAGYGMGYIIAALRKIGVEVTP